MNKGLVTVVVPIYNTEKYLDRCIESIVNQTYRNLEIILVDDGSPDNCPQMCDAWAKKDKRICVIHKQNQGLGMARNTGIENASGEYICFFDSDDYIALDTVEKAYTKAAKEQAEVVAFGFSDVDAMGNVVKTFAPSSTERTFYGVSVCEDFLAELIAPNPKGNGERRFYMSACMMLFSVSAIRKTQWRFVSEREIISEDIYSLLGLFKNIESVTTVPEALYYYCVNEVSLSRKYMPGRYKRIQHFYRESLALCRELDYSTEVSYRVSKQYLAFTIAAMKQEMASQRPLVDRIKSIREIIEEPVLRQVLDESITDSSNWKKKILFWTIRKKMLLLCCAILLIQNQIKTNIR